MGITIHYTIMTKSEQKVNKIIQLAKERANELGKYTQYTIYEEEGKGFIEPFKVGIFFESLPLMGDVDYDTIDHEPTIYEIVSTMYYRGAKILFKVPKTVTNVEKWIQYNIKHNPEDYIFYYDLPSTELVAAKKQPPLYDYKRIVITPKTTESIDFTFVKIKDIWVCQSFTKTQPFHEDEYVPNTYVHMWLASLLHEIEKMGVKITVSDEGEYYETNDINILLKNFSANEALIRFVADVLNGMLGKK